jgi:hypothetical protein
MGIHRPQGRKANATAKIKDESGELPIGTSGFRKQRMRRNRDSGLSEETDLLGVQTRKSGKVFGGSDGGASVYIAKD